MCYRPFRPHDPLFSAPERSFAEAELFNYIFNPLKAAEIIGTFHRPFQFCKTSRSFLLRHTLHIRATLRIIIWYEFFRANRVLYNKYTIWRGANRRSRNNGIVL